MPPFSVVVYQGWVTKRTMSLNTGQLLRLSSIMALWMIAACAHTPPWSLPRDPAAERIVDRIKQTNTTLQRFKCIAKITVSGPERSHQVYRSAIAGQLDSQLRIDLFAPFGGAAGTVASNGKKLFLVLHASRDYHTTGFGNGSLKRLIKIDITVGDLLELLVGRIPVDSGFLPQTMPLDDTEQPGVCLVDRWGKTRQRITLDATGRPLTSEWFDSRYRPVFSLVRTGQQLVDGFVLPRRVDLLATGGQKVSIILERYQANVPLDDRLFTPPPISS